MMLFLGLIDLLAAAILLSQGFNVRVPIMALILIPICLFSKSLINIFDIGSITDIVVALLIVLGIFLHLPWQLLLVVAIIMAIKGLLSFVALS